MSSKIDRRLLDTNAAAMGGGVGLAVLESMFSLVQSQSVMNAAMVRDYQLSHPLVMESLAVALTEILDPYGEPFDDDDTDGVVVPIHRGRRGRSLRRAVKARRRPPGADDQTILGSGNDHDDGGPGTPEPPSEPNFKGMNVMKAPSPAADGGGTDGSAGVQELAQVLSRFVEEIKNAKPQDDGPGAQSTTTTTKTSEHVESAAQMEALITAAIPMIDKLLEGLVDVNKSAVSAPALMVT